MRRNAGHISLMLMIIVTMVTQVLTLMKSSAVAGIFGASDAMDAYNLSNSIATFVFGFVSAGISTIVIPEYANKRNKKAVDTFITLIYGLLLGVILLMMAFRFQIAAAFNNRDEAFAIIVANILVVLLAAQYMSSIANVTVAYFQCEGKYNIPKIMNMLSQLLVVAILMSVNNISIIEYSFIIAAGMLLSFAVDTTIAIKNGWHYKPTYCLSDDTKLLFKRFLPIVFSTGAYNLSLMIDSTISALLEVGKITVLSYSSQIATMVNTIVIGNVLVYIYPKITKNINKVGAQSVFWNQTVLFHAIVCLMISGFLTVGQDAVLVLFYHDAFSLEACNLVFYGAAIYIFGQQMSMIRNMIYRYFYAVGDTKTPASNSVMVSVFNITISLILVKLIGFYGIILGTIAASLISLMIIMIRFGQKIGYSEKITSIIGKYLFNLLIMVGTIVIVNLSKTALPIENQLLRILVFGMETVMVYLLIQLLTNRKMLSTLKTL